MIGAVSGMRRREHQLLRAYEIPSFDVKFLDRIPFFVAEVSLGFRSRTDMVFNRAFCMVDQLEHALGLYVDFGDSELLCEWKVNTQIPGSDSAESFGQKFIRYATMCLMNSDKTVGETDGIEGFSQA